MMYRLFKLIVSILAVIILLELATFLQSGTSWVIFRNEQLNRLYLLLYEPSQKFWAHRCDSIEKVELMSKKYSGIEIDAVFYDTAPAGKKFDISHDEQSSIKYPFEGFMTTIAENKDTKIWFDFKNLTRDNAEESLNELEYLLAKYNIDKKRFIIESHDYGDLGLYHQHGFYTSFYVSVNDELIFNGGESDFINEVQEAVNSQNIDAVSFPLNYYGLLKSADIPLDFLTWQIHDEKWWQFYRKDNLKKLIDDEQVKVILVSNPTMYDR